MRLCTSEAACYTLETNTINQLYFNLIKSSIKKTAIFWRKNKLNIALHRGKMDLHIADRAKTILKSNLVYFNKIKNIHILPNYTQEKWSYRQYTDGEKILFAYRNKNCLHTSLLGFYIINCLYFSVFYYFISATSQLLDHLVIYPVEQNMYFYNYWKTVSNWINFIHIWKAYTSISYTLSTVLLFNQDT